MLRQSRGLFFVWGSFVFSWGRPRNFSFTQDYLVEFLIKKIARTSKGGRAIARL